MSQQPENATNEHDRLLTAPEHSQLRENHNEYSASPGDLTNNGSSQPFLIPRKPLTRLSSTEVTSDSNGHDLPLSDKQLTWRPSYLRIWVLVLFEIIFCSLIALLEIVYQISQKHQGLVSSSQKAHYLWTYGPSAIFIVLTALWTRVEYQIKEITPWISMAAREAKATKSILLDYVSMFQPLAIYSAFRNRHPIVAISGVCTLLCRALIVLSAALLVLIPSDVRYDNVPVDLTGTFEFDSARYTDHIGLPFYWLSSLSAQKLSYPIGLTPDLAYIPFDAKQLPYNSTIESITPTVHGDLVCEDAELDIQEWWIAVPQLGNITDDYPTLMGLNQSMTSSRCHTNFSGVVPGFNVSEYYATFQPVTCDGTEELLSGHFIFAMHIDIGDLHSGTFVNGTIQDSNLQDELVPNITALNMNPVIPVTYQNFTVRASKLIFCTRTWSMQDAKIRIHSNSLDLQPQSVTLQPDPVNESLDGSEYWNESPDVDIAVESPFLEDADVDKKIMIGMNLRDAGRNVSVATLLEPNVLEDVSRRYFRAITAVYARLSLLKYSVVAGNGTAVVTEARLHVSMVTTRAMESILAVVTLINLYILVRSRGWKTVPRNPITILNLAALLNQSSGLLARLKGTGISSLKSLDRLLAGRIYISGHQSKADGGHFVVSVRDEGRSTVHSEAPKIEESTFEPWQPFIIGLTGKAIACSILVSLFVALEVMFQTSQKHDGLGNAKLDGYLHYTWSSVPTLVFVCISLWFSSIDFNIRCLGPFFSLKKGDIDIRSISATYLDASAGTTLYKSLRGKQWAVFLTALAAFLGSFLTIVVSGVFVTVNKPTSAPVQLQVTTYFGSIDMDSPDGSEGSNMTSAAAIAYSNAGLILYGNVSYPIWTYKDLAFPQLEILSVSDSDHGINATQNLTVRVTATKASLDCEFYTLGGIRYFPNSTYTYVNFSTSACQNQVSINNRPDGYFGFYSGSDSSYYCADDFFYWGHNDANGKVESFTAMGCKSAFYDVDVDITFIGPNMTISDQNPPTEHNDTIKPSTAAMLIHGLDWLTATATNNTLDFDPFFSAVVFGRYGVSLSHLNDPNAQGIVADAAKKTYSVIQAQRLNSIIRTPLNTTGPSFNGTITDIGPLRVVQDAASTRVLESFILTMLLCTIVATTLTAIAKADNVLPKNPCSIAAKASLLADSSLVTRGFMPEHAEFMSDKELRSMVKGLRFGIGWFDTGFGGRVFKIDVLGDREKASWDYHDNGEDDTTEKGGIPHTMSTAYSRVKVLLTTPFKRTRNKYRTVQ